MHFKKLNLLQELILKYSDKQAYIFYKNSKIENKFYNAAIQIEHSSLEHLYKTDTYFKHSGNIGDIIYSLPAVLELSKNGKAHLLLNINRKGSYLSYHPLGDLMLNQKMLDMLRPLLLYQPQIETCEIYNGEKIDYDLDLFRSYPLLLDRGNISRWYFWLFAISPSLNTPWLVAPKENSSINDFIIVARSHRYRNPGISYNFLNAYHKVLFIGILEEYEDMKKAIPKLEYRPVNDFLEMASLINSCKLFIGNQSFPFALAEGLKVNRLLEVYYKDPNVSPEGMGAHDFIFQPQFQKLTAELYNLNT